MNRMLIDAVQSEETRVATLDGQYLENLDVEVASRRTLKGNIYLAKVMRVEPSLQAAFVDFGGNRHGFLPFTEIHPDYFRIPVGDRPPMLDDDQDQGSDEGMDAAEMAEYQADAAELAAEQNMDEPGEVAPIADGSPQVQVQPVPVAPVHAPMQAPPAFDPWQTTAPGSGALSDLLPDFANQGPVTNFGQPAPMPVAPMPDMPAQPQAAQPQEARPPRQYRPRYKIQEVIKRGMVMLIQVVKEERGTKGAALTTYLSLAGRYCVLMPNTLHQGGVSRKITDFDERRRMRELLDQLEVPEGMGVILRTAGMDQTAPEIQRDLDFLLRLWNNTREQTLQSNAPALIYEEANLIKRALRDFYTSDTQEILVAGDEGYKIARDYMATLVPEEVGKIKPYTEPVPIFSRFGVERQIDNLHSNTVQLRSGGYIVINTTEALVAIDVNSGRSTRERHIEETAYRTNLEAAGEVARQLRLRDLAGLIVIDFIDMEDSRNNYNVERRFREAMRIDRARVQIGRISQFGLLELSRQRLRPSLIETHFEKCPACAGSGYVRAAESSALGILRALEDEGLRRGSGDITVQMPSKVALYLLNNKRHAIGEIERRYGLTVEFVEAEVQDFVINRQRGRGGETSENYRHQYDHHDHASDHSSHDNTAEAMPEASAEAQQSSYGREENRRGGRDRGGRRRHGRGGGGGGGYQQRQTNYAQDAAADPLQPVDGAHAPGGEVTLVNNFNSDAANNIGNGADYQPQQASANENDDDRGRRRRGRRGGRRRQGGGGGRDRFEGGDHRRRDGFQGGGEGRAQPLSVDQNVSGAAAQPPSPRTSPVVPLYVEPPREQVTERPAAQHEVVNPPPAKPKAGWWQRLTGSGE